MFLIILLEPFCCARLLDTHSRSQENSDFKHCSISWLSGWQCSLAWARVSVPKNWQIILSLTKNDVFLAYYVTNNSSIYFTGVRSYGKVVYLFFFLKFTGFLIFAAKVIDVLPLNTFRFWIEKTEWMEFIYNGEVCYYPYIVRTWDRLYFLGTKNAKKEPSKLYHF